MTSADINKGLVDIFYHNPELKPKKLPSIYKNIPFHCFDLKEINFDKRIWLGLSPYLYDDGKSIEQWVGFCPKPMYAYVRIQVSEQGSKNIRKLTEDLVTLKTLEASEKLYEYLQSFIASQPVQTQQP